MSTGNIITEGATGSKSKEGVVQWVVPYYATNINEVLTAGNGEYQEAQEVSRTWSCNNDGPDPSYIVTVTYEGGDNGSGGGSNAELWSVDFEMSEEPIASHWNWERIKTKYQATNLAGDERYHDEWAFPKTLDEGGGGGSSSGLQGKKKSGTGDKNPMYGVTTYIVMTAIVSVSYSKKTLPRSVIDDIGKLYTSIPGAPSQIGSLDTGKRNWMKIPPQISKRGKIWQVTESWRLSEYYEWPKEVYSDGSAANLT